jgi:hypothetical protein
MRTALVVITIKQRVERIRSMTASVVALAADRIWEIIPTSTREVSRGSKVRKTGLEWATRSDAKISPL